MRLLEITLPIILAIWLLFPRRPHSRWLEAVPLVAGMETLTHLVFEGYRWQMVPLYLLVLVCGLIATWNLLRPQAESPSRARIIKEIGIGAAALALATALPALFPIPKIPEPAGIYPVGTITRVLVDTSRKEIYGPEPGSPRRVLVQVWYPAEPVSGAETAPWMEDAELVAPAISEWIDMPSFFLDHLVYAESHSDTDAPLSVGENNFPVVTFSHGWGGFRSQSTFLMEELASQGFVVVSIEHPYGSLMTVLPDGEILPHDPKILPDGAPDEEYDAAARKLVNQWAEDIGFVLDTMAAWNSSDPDGRFTGRLDLAHVGVSGHSTGGGAAIEFCDRDPRCTVGLPLDAWLTPVSEAAIQSGPEQPFLFLYSELWPSEKNEALFGTLFSGMQGKAYRITISGTDHYDFSDLPALSPLAPALKLKGPLAADRVQAIILESADTFFKVHLLGADPVSVDMLAFPEASVWTNK